MQAPRGRATVCLEMPPAVSRCACILELIAVAAMTFVLATRPAAALDEKTRITQYRHTAWRVQEGAFESAPNAITQTADGYIWIGTDSGLVKYDGVRFQRWTLGSDKSVFET